MVKSFCTIIGIALIATACDGSSSSGDVNNLPPANRAPAADAGPDRNAMTGESLALDGNGSTDPDGDTLAFAWSIESGPADGATLTDADSAIAAFQATEAGTYVVSLVVSDPDSASATATITVIVTEAPSVDVTSVTIDRPWVFLAGTGSSAALHAQALGSQGETVAADVTWSSTAPDQVFVDSNGELLAAGIGSALIFAEAGGVRSAPTLVAVADPVPGALLLTDDQIISIGEPIGVPPGTFLEVGMRYEVTLSGLSAPPVPGTVVLAAENAAVAGKVVAAEQSGTTYDVVLELVPLYELLARYHIDWSIDLDDFPLVAMQSETASAATTKDGKQSLRPAATNGTGLQAAPVVAPFEAFECDGEARASLISSEINLSPQVDLTLIVQDYRDDPALPPGYSKHALVGSETLTGTVAIKLKANISATGSCVAQAKFNIPVGGWISIFVMPAVRLGLGVELAGTLTVAEGEISATGKVGSTQTLGWACGEVSAECRGLDDISLLNDFKFKAQAPSLNGMHVDASGHFFVLLGLDLVFLASEHAKIIEARIGPKQSIDLGLEDDQAKNESYASNYDLRLEGVVEPGSALQAAIKKLIDDDGVGVTFKGKFEIEPRSDSPRGTFEASKSRVGLGNTVDFSVQLQAAALNYAVIGYNVDAIELWRKKEDEVEFTLFHAIPVSASNQSLFQYRWEPAAEDVGKSEFAAFVRTMLPVSPILEVSANSVLEVEVSCFSSGTQAPVIPAASAGALGGQAITAAATNVCADEWVGTSSHIIYDAESTSATVTWQRDPAFQGLPGQVQYVARGSLEFHHLILEDGDCTVSPTVFPISPPGPADSNHLIVDYAFSPPLFAGAGIHSTELTISCPDDDPFTFPASISWFNDAGTVSEDGLTIEGGITTAQGVSSYRFTRP